jgi:hypothetical protein
MATRGQLQVLRTFYPPRRHEPIWRGWRKAVTVVLCAWALAALDPSTMGVAMLATFIVAVVFARPLIVRTTEFMSRKPSSVLYGDRERGQHTDR